MFISQGRYSKAESLYQQALAITKQQLGENHPFYWASFIPSGDSTPMDN